MFDLVIIKLPERRVVSTVERNLSKEASDARVGKWNKLCRKGYACVPAPAKTKMGIALPAKP
jgi:hypothetical protein